MNFEHLSKERQQLRWRASIEAALKIWVGAFFWQGFALACDCSYHSTSYLFLSGFGAGLGALVCALVPFVFTGFRDFDPAVECIRGAMLGLAIFLGPGTIWQRVVNDSADWGWTFTAGFFYMWLLSGLMFLASMTVMRKVAYYAQKHLFDHNVAAVDSVTKQFYHDFTLAFCVGLGDAFFMGTCGEEFPNGNWLSAFATYDSTDAFVAMLLAGTSTFIGFLIAQAFQNIVFPDCWADNVAANMSTKPLLNGDFKTDRHTASTDGSSDAVEFGKVEPRANPMNSA